MFDVKVQKKMGKIFTTKKPHYAGYNGKREYN